MKIKEVRVGNLGIHNGEIAEVIPTSFSNGKVEEMQPIPITEEWLLKLGFELDKGIWKQSDLIEIEIRHGIGAFLVRGVFMPVVYVHQLQNLYHALTGQELEIKK